jgi:hypothetical protein
MNAPTFGRMSRTMGVRQAPSALPVGLHISQHYNTQVHLISIELKI